MEAEDFFDQVEDQPIGVKPAKPRRKKFKSQLEQDLAPLQKGANFTAYGKRVQPAIKEDEEEEDGKEDGKEGPDEDEVDDEKRRVHVWYQLPMQEMLMDSSDLGTIYWCDMSLKQMKPQSLEESLPIQSIRQLFQGKETKALLSESASKAVDENCLSIVSDTGFVLNLEAFSNPILTAWMRGLQRLLTSAGKMVQEQVPNSSNSSSFFSESSTLSSQSNTGISPPTFTAASPTVNLSGHSLPSPTLSISSSSSHDNISVGGGVAGAEPNMFASPTSLQESTTARQRRQNPSISPSSSGSPSRRRGHNRKETRIFSILEASQQLLEEDAFKEGDEEGGGDGEDRESILERQSVRQSVRVTRNNSLNQLISKHSRQPTQGAWSAAWRTPASPKNESQLPSSSVLPPMPSHPSPPLNMLNESGFRKRESVLVPPALPFSTPRHKMPLSLQASRSRSHSRSVDRGDESPTTPYDQNNKSPASPPSGLSPPSPAKVAHEGPANPSSTKPKGFQTPVAAPISMNMCCRRARAVLSPMELASLSDYTHGRLDVSTEQETGVFFDCLWAMPRHKWFVVLDCYVIGTFQSTNFLNNLIHKHNWTRWILPLMLASPSESEPGEGERRKGGDEEEEDEEEQGMLNPDEERKLFDYLMLLVVELHAHCFHKSNEGSYGSTNMQTFLDTSLELVRKMGMAGGNTHAATVNRLILWTLLNKVSSGGKVRPQWAQGDVKMVEWINLFPMLSCVETFLFFEKGDDMGGDIVQLLDGRSSRSKRVTLHLDKQSLDCLDLPLVEKVLSLLNFLRIHELDACVALDAQSRKLQKQYKTRGMEEISFYSQVQQFFKGFSTISAEKSVLRKQLELGTSPLISLLAARGKGKYGTKKELTIAFQDLVKRCVRKQQSGIAAIASYAANRYMEATGASGGTLSRKASAKSSLAIKSYSSDEEPPARDRGTVRGTAGTTHSTSPARDVVLSFAQQRFGAKPKAKADNNNKNSSSHHGQQPFGKRQNAVPSRRDTALARPVVTSSQRYTHCALHRKPFEYRCQADGELVCSSCLLRGAHIQHPYQEIEDFLTVYRKESVEQVSKLRSNLVEAKERLKEIATSMHSLIDEEAPLVNTIKSDTHLLGSLLRSSLRELRKSLVKKCKSPHVPQLEARISRTQTVLRHMEEWEMNQLPLTKQQSQLPPWTASLMHIHKLCTALKVEPSIDSLTSVSPPTFDIDFSGKALAVLTKAIASHGTLEFVASNPLLPTTTPDTPTSLPNQPLALIRHSSSSSTESLSSLTSPEVSSSSGVLSSGDYGSSPPTSGRFSARTKRLSLMKQRSASILHNPPPPPAKHKRP